MREEGNGYYGTFRCLIYSPRQRLLLISALGFFFVIAFITSCLLSHLELSPVDVAILIFVIFTQDLINISRHLFQCCWLFSCFTFFILFMVMIIFFHSQDSIEQLQTIQHLIVVRVILLEVL